MSVTAMGWLVALAVGASLPADMFLRDRAIGPGRGADRLVLDVQLGRAGAEDRLETWLRDNPRAAKDARLTGHQVLCGAYFRAQRFADGIRACTAAESIEAGSAGNMLGLQQIFLTAGPAKWSGPAVTIPLKDKQYAVARRGQVEVDTLVDTGAELAAISESVARKLEARPVGAGVTVGTTTAPVSGAIVTIDRVRIGDGELRNLTAIVISDQQSAMSGINLIVPLPAIVALGRFAYLDHGTRLALGAAAPSPGPNRTALYWDEGGIGFAAGFARGRRGVHFDSGSVRTYLFPAALAALSPRERATRSAYQRKITGLGGERIEQASRVRNVRISVGGLNWTFSNIEVAEKDENGEAARIGTALFDRFRTVLFDARSMQMSVRE